MSQHLHRDPPAPVEQALRSPKGPSDIFPGINAVDSYGSTHKQTRSVTASMIFCLGIPGRERRNHLLFIGEGAPKPIALAALIARCEIPNGE